ncbi:MAG: hypothetical protein AB8C46_16120 [Burkholderiaceae bacterium]
MKSDGKLKFCAMSIAVSTMMLSPLVTSASDGPYVVSGNQHIMVGITLDEAAVREALPKGLEPAEGITGGLNVYNSEGGDGVAAYGRFYVWVDLKGHDSVNGAKARYILWAATSTGPGKLKAAGNLEVKGDTTLNKDGSNVTGVTTIDGKQIVKAAITMADDAKCGPASGSVNYPSLPDPSAGMVMTQYTFSASICGATPVSAEIMVDDDHPLAKFKPQKVVWAAFVPKLSFSGSPLIPIKMADK